MNAAKIEETIKRIVSEHMGVEVSALKPETHVISDLGGDSLDTVELAMALEDEFGIEIPDEDAPKLMTTKEAVEYISSRLKV